MSLSERVRSRRGQHRQDGLPAGIPVEPASWLYHSPPARRARDHLSPRELFHQSSQEVLMKSPPLTSPLRHRACLARPIRRRRRLRQWNARPTLAYERLATVRLCAVRRVLSRREAKDGSMASTSPAPTHINRAHAHAYSFGTAMPRSRSFRANRALFRAPSQRAYSLRDAAAGSCSHPRQLRPYVDRCRRLVFSVSRWRRGLWERWFRNRDRHTSRQCRRRSTVEAIRSALTDRQGLVGGKEKRFDD